MISFKCREQMMLCVGSFRAGKGGGVAVGRWHRAGGKDKGGDRSLRPARRVVGLRQTMLAAGFDVTATMTAAA